MTLRKIIHIDMDAFFASVEIRDQPHLKGKPVLVAWDGARSVVCAASYEARQFGVHAAMSVAQAKKRCPHAIYIAPNFDKYRAASQQIHQVFRQYSHLIEPLSLDEAYLDVTHNLKNLPSATAVAHAIRADIFQLTGLTASAGIAPNKFLAKIASDINKPNGLCIIKPSQVDDFLRPLPVSKIFGVGRVALAKLHHLNIHSIADLAQHSQAELSHHFGRYGFRLYELARGIDERPVLANQQRQQLSTETTFMQDKHLSELAADWQQLSQKLWTQLGNKQMRARGVTIKLKTSQFKIITRSMSFHTQLSSQAALQHAINLLLTKVDHLATVQLRLIGVGVSQLSPCTEANRQLLLLDDD